MSGVGEPPLETCARCGVEGSDLKILDCGCYLHVKCTPVLQDSPMAVCPACQQSCRAIYMFPMSFAELDEARETAAAASNSGKREKKRKTATIARLNPEVVSSSNAVEESGGVNGDDLRTGRWTNDEMAYCDKLIAKFETGELPCADGIKLNDFLANMLKSKQSRLTKKMKNAKLSARSFKRTSGYVLDPKDAREFSELENAFFRSISCSMERAEVRFHLQKEWRELFSSFCVQSGQKLEADDWLTSVEEMDRRASRSKDAAKMARRKKMMGYALEHDSMNPVQGVFIESNKSASSSTDRVTSETEERLAAVMAQRQKRQRGLFGSVVPVQVRKTIRAQPPPFLGRILTYMQRQCIPFEHVDAWVPSFVSNQNGQGGTEQQCRLCFAGCATAEVQVANDGQGSCMVPMSKEDQFDFHAFGEYTQKFSFDVGCGLPGRVYHTGVPSWEQHVQNAPVGHFERSGGALQWGIKTVLGIPVPSPNVGRVVVLFYSRHDRPQNQEMVARTIEEMTKLMPAPKWKLVVDVGAPDSSSIEGENPTERPERKKDDVSTDKTAAQGLLSLLTELMPTSSASPLAPYLAGFTALRMMLLKPNKSTQEMETLNCIVESYSSYMRSGRPQSDVALLVVRDFLSLSQSQTSFSQNATMQIQQHQAQHFPFQIAIQPNHHLQPQQMQHQQSHHSMPVQHVTFAHGMDAGHATRSVEPRSVEPAPVSQLHGMNSMVPQQQQQHPSQQQQQQHIRQHPIQQEHIQQNATQEYQQQHPIQEHQQHGQQSQQHASQQQQAQEQLHNGGITGPYQLLAPNQASNSGQNQQQYILFNSI